MREAERIADQLWFAYEGQAWHGPALMELLRGVTAAEAAAKPVAGAHSIWELVEHVATWSRVSERKLCGEDYPVSDAENFPVVPVVSEDAWAESRRALAEITQALRDQIRVLDDSRLEDKVPNDSGQPVSVYVVLHGIVQHNLYHAGQIALLKRALRG